MNQPMYQPAYYQPAAYPPQPGPYPQPQPGGYPPMQPAAGVQPQPGPAPLPGPYPQPGYYAPQPYACQPVPQGQWAAPAFAVKPPKDPRKTGGTRAVNFLCLVVLVQMVISFLAGSLLMAVMTALGINLYQDDVAMQLYTVAMSPVSLLPPFFIYMFLSKQEWGASLRFERKGFFRALLMVLAALGVGMLANIPANLLGDFLESLGAVDNTDLLNPTQTLPGFWVQLVGVAVMVPMLEEFGFRGVIFTSLERYGTGFAIVGSALIFGMAHLSVVSVVFATVAGLAMAVVYAKTRNLWATVAVHALNNGIAVVDGYAEMLVGPDRADGMRDLLFLAPVILGSLALILLMVLWLVKRRAANRPAPAPAPEGGPEGGEAWQQDRAFAVNREAPPWPGTTSAGGPGTEENQREAHGPSAEEALPPLRFGEAAGCLARAPAFWCMVAAVAIMVVTMFL